MGKNKTLGRKFIPVDERDPLFSPGDLYILSRIDAFKERIAETQLQERLSTENVDLLIMGDSFFNTGFDSDPVPNALEKTSGIKVFYQSTSKKNLTPRQYLARSGYKKGSPKLFIWEMVERKSLERIQELDTIKKSPLSKAAPLNSKNDRSSLQYKVFDRVDVEYFIKNNQFVLPVNRWLRNRAYDWFGDISGKTPIFSRRPPLLFLDEEVEFYKNTEKPNTIDGASGLVEREAVAIKELYNLTLVIIVIPNKLTIYGDTVFVDTPYDQYIPRLQSALARRNVS
ncbi:MAG: hypothetical protein AAB416_00775, partial [Patescibacteria group bacterium]